MRILDPSNLFRSLGWLSVLLVLLSTTSCRRAFEKTAQKIRVEAVESVTSRGLSGLDVTLRVANGSGYKLSLDTVRADIYCAGGRVGRIVLRDRVEVAKRTTASVSTRWQMKIYDPLALYALIRKMDRGDYSNITVSYTVSGHGGPFPINISQEMVLLSDFLNIFGLKNEDIKNFLKR